MAVAVAYDASTGSAKASRNALGFSVMYKVMDSAAIITAAGGTGLASATKITAAEAVTAMVLPVGFQVWGTAVYVVKAGTSAGTIDIGTPDTGSNSYEVRFDAAVSLATAGAYAASATDASAIASGGLLISATTSDADNVIVQYNSDDTDSVFVLCVFGMDFSWMAEVAQDLA
jgi:hypothetical protein